MTKLFIFISILVLSLPGYAQLQYKEQLEFGFRGKVKKVIKKSFQNPPTDTNEVLPDTNSSVTIHNYYFNVHSNIDSFTTQRTLPDGGIYSYTTTCNFVNFKKTSWIAIDANNKKLANGKVEWLSGKEVSEKVFDTDDKLKYETVRLLDDSFRLARTTVKAYDEDGEQVLNTIQEFKLDKNQNIDHYKITQVADGSTELTSYKYQTIDRYGNPTKLLMIKQKDNYTTLVIMEYIYY